MDRRVIAEVESPACDRSVAWTLHDARRDLACVIAIGICRSADPTA